MYNMEQASSTIVASVTTAILSLDSMIRQAMRGIHGLRASVLSSVLSNLTDCRLAIDISSSCTMSNGLIDMINVFSEIAEIDKITVDYLLGSCSGTIRGIAGKGPMSGAKILDKKISSTGFKSSALTQLASIDENMGKASVTAALSLCRYGETKGGTDPSQYGGELSKKEITSYLTAQESANIESIISVVRLSAIVMATKIAIRIDYSNYNAVMDTLDEITTAIDIELLKLGDDSIDDGYENYDISIANSMSYEGLQSLRLVFVKSMVSIGASLAKIVDYDVPPSVLSSLVLAYDKYEKLEREQEIINRNIPFVKHPGFLPSGKEIEILSK